MARYVFVVMSNPVAGREAEYNTWYDDVHLRDVCSFPGYIGARRFRLVEGGGEHRYMALYEIDSDDPQRTLATLTAAAGTDRMLISEALDMGKVSTALFEQIAVHGS